MWVLASGKNRFLIGPVEYDRSGRTVRFLPEFTRGVLGGLLPPLSPGDLIRGFRKTVRLESHPVPRRPDRAWVAVFRHPVTAGMRDLTRPQPPPVSLVVGQISPDGLVFRRDFSLPGTISPTGLFRFRMTAISPRGDLVFPGKRVSADFDVVDDPEIGPGLQGFTIENGRDVPVSGLRPACGGHGVLHWSDGRMALWSLHASMESATGTLAMVDVRKAGRCMWRIENAVTGDVYALPDGRWAALLSGRGKRSLAVGLASRFRIIPAGDVGFHPHGLRGVFPLPDDGWAIMMDGGVLFMRGTDPADVLMMGTVPHSVFHDALLTGDESGRLYLIPDRETVTSGIRVWEGCVFEGASSTGRLGGFVISRQPSDLPACERSAILLPSMTDAGVISEDGDILPLDVGEGGYLLVSLGTDGRIVLEFRDPSGEHTGSFRPGDVRVGDVTVLPVRGKHFAAMIRLRKDIRSGSGDFRIMTFDPNGNPVDGLDLLQMPMYARPVKRMRTGDGRTAIFLRFSMRPRGYGGGAAAVTERAVIVLIGTDGGIQLVLPV